MSHFLERLASGIIQLSTEPRLRPLPGSIYAPSHYLRSAESVSTPQPAAVVAAAPEGRQAATVEAAKTQASEPPFHREEASFAHSPVSPEILPLIPPKDRPAELSQPEDSSQVVAPRPERRAVALPATPPDARPAAPSHAAQRSEDREPKPAFVERGPGGQRDTQPANERMPAVTIQPSAPGPSRLLPPQPAPQPAEKIARTAVADAAYRPAPPAREPDEIHIHIGRIEVAAVSQPATRPAPVPTRKSLNLDEYLRRASGRAG